MAWQKFLGNDCLKRLISLKLQCVVPADWWSIAELTVLKLSVVTAEKYLNLNLAYASLRGSDTLRNEAINSIIDEHANPSSTLV